MPRKQRGRKPGFNRGWFLKGDDPRRHALTAAEKRKGGLTTAWRYLCAGRWHLDWLDRCVRKPKGEF